MLKRIGTLVRPIMKARGWTVKTLREFYPTNPSLLGVNVNKGLEIRIRLRPASNKNSFLEFNDLIGTMLHE